MQPDLAASGRFVVRLAGVTAGEDTPRVLNDEEITALRETKRAVSDYAATLLAERKASVK